MHEKVGYIAEKGTYATSVITILAALSLEHCAIIIGIICSIVVAAVTCYCKLRWLKIAEKKVETDKVSLQFPD